jgi:hypothetical protein
VDRQIGGREGGFGRRPSDGERVRLGSKVVDEGIKSCE